MTEVQVRRRGPGRRRRRSETGPRVLVGVGALLIAMALVSYIGATLKVLL